MNRKTPTRRAFQTLLLSALCVSAWAQGKPNPVAAWPTRPIRLLIGFPPGSVQDLSARAISEALARELGQPVIVENKAGASGTIAADQVAKATDLHTFGVMNNSQLTIARLLNPAVPYDPAKDLAPIALIATTPMMLVVSGSAPGNTPREWLEWLRGQGDRANYGSPGNGTPGHLGMELIKSKSGITATHVPYPGNPQIINAMLGDQLQAALLPPGLVMQQVKAGRMKAIGITSQRRSGLAPDQLPLTEVGIADSEVELWTALAGPASLPAAVRVKLGEAVIKLLKTDEIRQRLFTAGWQATPSSADGLRLRMNDDTKAFGSIINSRNIRSGG
jgi:tripartite-type tricarboxylate transporter receptor subunit TctC